MSPETRMSGRPSGETIGRLWPHTLSNRLFDASRCQVIWMPGRPLPSTAVAASPANLT